MGTAFLIVSRVIKTRGCHIGGTNGFDFLKLPVLVFTDDLTNKTKQEMVITCVLTRLQFFILLQENLNLDQSYLIKVSNDLVEQPETLHSFVVGF